MHDEKLAPFVSAVEIHDYTYLISL